MSGGVVFLLGELGKYVHPPRWHANLFAALAFLAAAVDAALHGMQTGNARLALHFPRASRRLFC